MNKIDSKNYLEKELEMKIDRPIGKDLLNMDLCIC